MYYFANEWNPNYWIIAVVFGLFPDAKYYLLSKGCQEVLIGFDYQSITHSDCHNCDRIGFFVTIVVTGSGPISKILHCGDKNNSGKRE